MHARESKKRLMAGIIRLLRLLDNGGAAVLEQDEAVASFRGEVRRFDRTIAIHCRSAGLVSIAGNAIAIRPEGKAWLRRALHPEAANPRQHVEMIRTPAEDGALPVKANIHESPLARLYLRKDATGAAYIDAAAFAAGERFRADFEKAGLQPRISANWEASIATRGRSAADNGISDFAMDARKRFNRAVEALGPDLSGVTTDICCFLKGLETVERERCWPPRSAKLMLRTGLQLLARHYGIAGQGNSHAAMRHWGADGFRPAIGRPPG